MFSRLQFIKKKPTALKLKIINLNFQIMRFSINEKPKFHCSFSRNHRHRTDVFLSFLSVFKQLLPGRHADKAWEPANKVLFFLSPPPTLKCLSPLPSSLPHSILLLLHLSLLSVYLWRPGFDSKLIHVRYLVDKVALGRVFLWVLQSSPVNAIPPVLHTDSYISTLLFAQGEMGKGR